MNEMLKERKEGTVEGCGRVIIRERAFNWEWIFNNLLKLENSDHRHDWTISGVLKRFSYFKIWLIIILKSNIVSYHNEPLWSIYKKKKKNHIPMKNNKQTLKFHWKKVHSPWGFSYVFIYFQPH